MYRLTERSASSQKRNPRWKRGDRRVIVHYHLYKNAGTSLDEFLRYNFDARWTPFEKGATDILKGSDLAAYLHDRPDVIAVSSHILRPLPLNGFNVFPIALVRHPLDRAYSVYSHSKRSDATYESACAARDRDFAGFVRWCLDNRTRGGVVITDYQVIHFSDASFRCPHIYEAVASEADLRQAIGFICSLPCIGVVDRFDEYFVHLRDTMSAWLGRTLLGDAARANASPEREKAKVVDAIGPLQETLGPKLLDAFNASNDLDLRLYEQTASLMDAQSSRDRQERSVFASVAASIKARFRRSLV